MSTIELTADDRGHGRLIVDGYDLSEAARDVTVNIGAGDLTTVVVTLRGNVAAKLDGRVDVLLPDDVREALAHLGWTAPRPPCGVADHMAVLRIAMEQHGMSATDLETCLRIYTRRGTLSRDDRALLDGMTQEDRTRWLLNRYGTDAIRAGVIAYTDGIGGA